ASSHTHGDREAARKRSERNVRRVRAAPAGNRAAGWKNRGTGSARDWIYDKNGYCGATQLFSRVGPGDGRATHPATNEPGNAACFGGRLHCRVEPHGLSALRCGAKV